MKSLPFLVRRVTSPFLMKARMRKPSYFGSKSHFGSEKGSEARVANIGFNVCGKGSEVPADAGD